MYGAEWLIGLGVLGLAIGLGCGYLLAARHGSAGRARQLEAQLTAARQELDDYRNEVVAQFSETARKFQTLNDSYTDLHEQLAKSSSVLCGDLTGPLLEAPSGHQDLIPAEIRDEVDALAAGANAPKAQREEVSEEIRVAEPQASAAASNSTPSDAAAGGPATGGKQAAARQSRPASSSKSAPGDAQPDPASAAPTGSAGKTGAQQRTGAEGSEAAKRTEPAQRAAGGSG